MVPDKHESVAGETNRSSLELGALVFWQLEGRQRCVDCISQQVAGGLGVQDRSHVIRFPRQRPVEQVIDCSLRHDVDVRDVPGLAGAVQPGSRLVVLGQRES